MGKRRRNDGQETQAAADGGEGAAASGAGDTDQSAGLVDVGAGDAGGNVDAGQGGGEADAGAITLDVSAILSLSETLPRYRSHKIVRAAAIGAMEIHEDRSATIALKGAFYPTFKTGPDWAARIERDYDDAGYFVVYEDGYTSWSPTKAFEEGYQLIGAPVPELSGTADEAGLVASAALGPIIFDLTENERDRLKQERRGAEIFNPPADKPKWLLHRPAAVALWSMQAAAMVVDPENYLVRHGLEEAANKEAAEFVVANRDAPATAIPMHLALKKLPGGAMKPSEREAVLWSVFRTVLLLVHDFCKAERLAAEAKPEAQASGWPGELAMKPDDAPMTAKGFELAR